jgi:hypothetical protein
MDLTPDGEAARVTAPAILEQVASTYRGIGRPAEAAFTAPYSAPSAGPPPWNVYVFELQTAFAVASEEPHGATRWQFGD